MEKKIYDANSCIMTGFFGMIGGKWKAVILYLVEQDRNRFSLLLEAMPGISKKVLTEQLRELEEDGLLRREVLVVKAPMVVLYSLSEKGKSLRKLIDGIITWTAEQA
ncbi:winged helix-turn-helix transcriptional regulator [Sphingobacterium spiritivorum]|uniref:winged helix-turn-helix transcriptional regulator n=1 Tax=Sphingobacterium TaxID=28453 RepID=UPI0025F380FF|nr:MULTISPECIES: helix-turn-helix domain-containing protein [unclassified Sphingobacterium]